jgi:hypothetical protein
MKESTVPDNHPRAQLCFIIKEYGQTIIAEPKRCNGILSDLAPQHRLEINLLITALEQKVAQELLKPSALIPVAMQLEHLAQRLHDNHGTQLEFAYWAVESWALALNVIQQSVPKTVVVPSPTPIKIITPSISTQQRIGNFIVQAAIARDIETGLTWLRFAQGQKWQNGTAVDDAKLVNWETAFEVAKKFNKQDGNAGYTDWRLPTVDELKTLIDKVKGEKGNYIDSAVFPNNASWFWSSSSNAYDSRLARIMDFNYGDGGHDQKHGSCAVRLVRRGHTPSQTIQSIPKIVITQPPPTTIIPSSSATQQRIGKFIVQDGIATDTKTGLIWLRFAHGQTWQNGTAVSDAEKCAWKNAFEVAKRFNQQGGYAGYTDWRLPTIDELKTLIDKVKGKPGNYIDADVFPKNVSLFASSSPDAYRSIFSNYASIVNFFWGYDFSDDKTNYGCAVRLVRTGQ